MKLNFANYRDKKEVLKRFFKELKNHIYYDLFDCEDKLDYDSIHHSFIDLVSNDNELMIKFFDEVKTLKHILIEDIEFTYNSDPACNSPEEVLSTYPGFHAILSYRVAHVLYKLGLTFCARIIAEEAHSETGIDIHPGASIGYPFFIDHGTGIVIGETSIIGHHCKIYQGVTLGALSLSRGQQLKSKKRHPTIGNNVTIYAGASILGGDVTIGDNVVIGSNVFLLKSIPANSKVVINEPELLVISKECKND